MTHSQYFKRPLETVDTIIKGLKSLSSTRLSPPKYTGTSGTNRIGLAVESMRKHTTDEGWQIFEGLKHNGYRLVGYNLPFNETNVLRIIQTTKPDIVVVQDEREWDVTDSRDFREPNARFFGTNELASRPDIFKLTILKDSHQRPDYHRDSAGRMGANGWIIYYHPRIVSHLASYIRSEHLVRTYHSLDPSAVPEWGIIPRQDRTLLSGAVSSAYPLRKLLFEQYRSLPNCDLLTHPGYGRTKCYTPEFLKTLCKYKVAICTASLYGYALRKIIEATACGCIVITNLPTDEVLPEIDKNLVRVPSDLMYDGITKLGQLISDLYSSWNEEKQRKYAAKAMAFYDYKNIGKKLAEDIELLRLGYQA